MTWRTGWRANSAFQNESPRIFSGSRNQDTAKARSLQQSGAPWTDNKKAAHAAASSPRMPRRTISADAEEATFVHLLWSAPAVAVLSWAGGNNPDLLPGAWGLAALPSLVAAVAAEMGGLKARSLLAAAWGMNASALAGTASESLMQTFAGPGLLLWAGFLGLSVIGG